MGAVPPWTPEAELPFLSSVARESSFAPSTRRIFLRVPSPTRYPLGPAEQSRRKKVSTTMRGNLFLFALLALFALAVTAQDVVVPRAAATTVASIVDPENQAQPTSTAAGSSDSTSTGSSGADSAAGAEGADDGSFKMSKGGMIAIIVVVVVVAVGGIVSTVLFFIAKKRQWEVRKSLKRVSRRLTGRSTAGAGAARDNRENRRTAVRMASPPAGKNRSAAPKQNKERDLEKGEKKPAGRREKPTMSAFSVETPVVKSWKDKVFGYKE